MDLVLVSDFHQIDQVARELEQGASAERGAAYRARRARRVPDRSSQSARQKKRRNTNILIVFDGLGRTDSGLPGFSARILGTCTRCNYWQERYQSFQKVFS